MLLSFVYFASILGQTLSQDTQYWLGVGPGPGDDPSSSPLPPRQHGASATSAQLAGVWRSYGSRESTAVTAGPEEGRGDGGPGSLDSRQQQSQSIVIAPSPDLTTCPPP